MFIFSVSMVFVFCLFRYKVVWLELVWQSSKSNVSVPVITRLKLVMALVAEFRYQSETEGFWFLPPYDDNLILHIFVWCFRAPSNQMTLNRAGAGRSLRLGILKHSHVWFHILLVCSFFIAFREKLHLLRLRHLGIGFVTKSRHIRFV